MSSSSLQTKSIGNFEKEKHAMVIGLKSRVSEILNRKRKLTLEMIRKLHEVLGIPTEVLVKEY